MKRIFLFFLMASTFVCARAQGFGAEFLVGANFSQVDGDQLGGYNKLGLNPGLQINREINADWEGAFEIRYSMKGAKKVIDPEGPPTFSLKLKYHYLEVPLLLKYKRFDKITPYAGPSIGFNVLGQRDENGLVTEVDGLNFTEIGFNLGATYHVTEKFGFDVRHSYSVLSVTGNNVVSVGPTWFNRNGWFNRLFTLGITYTP